MGRYLLPMHVERVLVSIRHGAPDNEGSGHPQDLLIPLLSTQIRPLFPIDPIDFMALKGHICVPGIRLPARKERKSRLRLLNSDDEDYEKGGRVFPGFERSKLIIDSNSITPFPWWLAPQEQKSATRPPNIPNRGPGDFDTPVPGVPVCDNVSPHLQCGSLTMIQRFSPSSYRKIL